VKATRRHRLGIDLDPTMALEDLAQNKPVLGQVVGVTLAPLLHQPGRALDVREEERDAPARKLPHPLII